MASSQVLDEARQRVHAKRLAVEKHKQEVQDWCAKEEANSLFLKDGDFSNCTNVEAQLGQALYHDVFENMLRPLLPANVIITDSTIINPLMVERYGDYKRMESPDLPKMEDPSLMRVCAQVLPDGKTKTLALYKKGLLPERSTVRCKEKIMRDASVWHLDRKDTPKAEYRDGEFHYEPGTVKPGWKKILEPYGTSSRGWRTVLIHLVQGGVLSPQIVESKFGADNTRAWAGHTGKANLDLPW